MLRGRICRLHSRFNTITGYVITAVIPVHNRADLLERLLDSIEQQTCAFAEVLVVDNGSTDQAANIARERGCQVIPMHRNAGFARAVNEGCRAATQPWIAILNSDVELAPRWAEQLLAESGKASFLTGTIYNAQNRQAIDGTYDLLSRAGCAWRAGHGETESAGTGGPVPIAMTPATACLYRREVLAAAGGFDESFGSYLEDVDLGLRCLALGHTGVYVPGALAWHHGSATLGRWNGRVVRLISRNQLLLIARHYDRALFRRCFPQILAGQLLWGLVALRHGAFLAWLAGKTEALRTFRLRGNPTRALYDFLRASEAEIRKRSRDPYWRWYFRLTSGAAH